MSLFKKITKLFKSKSTIEAQNAQAAVQEAAKSVVLPEQGVKAKRRKQKRGY
jgi:hypothetical protein